MSYSHLDYEDEPSSSAILPQLGRYAKLAVWSVLNAALLFCEQLGELMAPLFMIGGIIWWAIPRILGGDYPRWPGGRCVETGPG